MDHLTINGVEYCRIKKESEELRIVCVDSRGLLFVGYVNTSGKQEQITIRNARCIIRWGTECHIAELVNGPLENTRLGAIADVDVFRGNLQFSYRVTGDWGIDQ